MFLVTSVIPHGNDYFRSHRALQCTSFFSYWFFYPLCICILSAVGLFFLLFLTSLVYVFLVFLLSLWSLCECDVVSYVLILFMFGSVVLVLPREAFFSANCFSNFVVVFMLYFTCGGISLPFFMSSLRVD